MNPSGFQGRNPKLLNPLGIGVHFSFGNLDTIEGEVEIGTDIAGLY
jgi:hypothetical protein